MTDILSPTSVDLAIDAASRDDALAAIAAFARRLGVTDDEAGVAEELRRRESESTTGLLDGIAIPHAKHASVQRPAILVAGFVTPIEWESLDGQPVVRAISLMIPEAEAGTTHLRLLSKVAETLIDDDVRQALLAASESAEIVALLSRDLDLEG